MNVNSCRSLNPGHNLLLFDYPRRSFLSPLQGLKLFFEPDVRFHFQKSMAILPCNHEQRAANQVRGPGKDREGAGASSQIVHARLDA